MLVDDHPMVVQGLQTTFELGAPEIKVIGKASTGEEAVSLAMELQPDIILMDIRMPGIGGIAATKIIKEWNPGICILVLTTFEDDDFIVDALSYGASGYLLKDIAGRELIQALKVVVRGGTLIAPGLAARVLKHIPREQAPPQAKTWRCQDGQAIQLTSREEEILRLIVKGKDNLEIAKTLYITTGTARNYVSHLYEKIGVRDRAQAVLFALRNGLMDSGSKE